MGDLFFSLAVSSFHKVCSYVAASVAGLLCSAGLNAADLPEIEEYQRRLPITENRVQNFVPNQYDVQGAREMGVKSMPVLSNEISPWNNKRHTVQSDTHMKSFPIKQFKVHSYTPLTFDVKTPAGQRYAHPKLDNVLEMKTVSKYQNARVSDMASYGNRISRRDVAGSKLMAFPNPGDFTGEVKKVASHGETKDFVLKDLNRFTPMRNPSRAGDPIPRISAGSNR